MKTFLALMALTLGSSAFAAIPDATTMTCQDVRDYVRNNGVTPMTFGSYDPWGGDNYLVIYDNVLGGSCPFSDDNEVQVFAPTLDADQCNVGFYCERNTQDKARGGVLVIK
jgi:hypothetical protein